MSAQSIIVINAGSSSLKFSVYAIEDNRLTVVARGQIEGLGTAPQFKAKDHRGNVLVETSLEHAGGKFGAAEAFAHISKWLEERFAGQYTAVAVGHRVVHGGTKFVAPTLLTPQVITELEDIIPLVPLHQPHNLAVIKAVSQLHPKLLQMACFDTAFHQGRAKLTQRFGLPDELFEQGVRRWGFHGISYEYISKRFHALAPELANGRVIVAHLGSGASLCGMREGRCVDTTMSFSTLDGLPMGTRCGSLDPGVILYLLKRGISPDEIETLLYKKSGLLGISGETNDVRDLLKKQQPVVCEAIEYFVYRIIREIGSLASALGGLDALIFTAGIGENSAPIRKRTCQGLGWLNIAIDDNVNERNDKCISPAGQTPSVWVIPTDEEGVIASHTLALIRSRA